MLVLYVSCLDCFLVSLTRSLADVIGRILGAAQLHALGTKHSLAGPYYNLELNLRGTTHFRIGSVSSGPENQPEMLYLRAHSIHYSMTMVYYCTSH
jgi:hypothetical protein